MKETFKNATCGIPFNLTAILSFPTDSQLDLDLDFDRAILIDKYTLIQTVALAKSLALDELLEGESPSEPQVFSISIRIPCRIALHFSFNCLSIKSKISHSYKRKVSPKNEDSTIMLHCGEK